MQPPSVDKRPMPHPADIAGMVQSVRWQDFQDKATYHLELISYLKAQPHPFKDGGYFTFAALVLAPARQPMLEKDALICVGLPYKTLINAIQILPLQQQRLIRRQEMEGKNLMLLFTKVSRQAMRIQKIEVRQCFPEVEKQAEEAVYAQGLLMNPEG